MTTATEPQAVPVQAHIILRDGEWVGVYDLSRGAALDDLRKHCRGAFYSEEPFGDAWMLADTGAPEPLAVRMSTSEFDEQDWAMATVAFVRQERYNNFPIGPESIVAEVTFRVDGRA